MKLKKTLVAPNIYRLQNGKYMVDKTFGTKENARRFRQTTASLRQAKRVLMELDAKAKLKRLPNAQRLNLKELINLTLPIKKKLRNWIMISRYRDKILDYFGSRTPVSRINRIAIENFRQHLLQMPCKGRRSGTLSNRSVDHRLAELRWLLRFAHEEGFIKKAPKVTLCGNYGVRDYNITLKDFLKVLPHLPPPPFPHRAMLLMALNTGMRWGDLATVKWHQIQKGSIRFRSSKTQQEGLLVPLMAKLRSELDRLPVYESIDFIFVNPATWEPYTNIRKPLDRAIREAGVPRFTMHTIRHLATTTMLEETKDRDLVQRVFGWSDQTMIKRYGHISDRAERAYQSLNAKIERQLDDT